jgi:uroporphyrinogen-III synthase
MPSHELGDVWVVVTRPAHQAERMVRLIEAAGGHAIRFPALAIQPPADRAALNQILDRLPDCQLAIFVSPNAVDMAWPHVLHRGGWPANTRVAAVGAGTARALQERGVAVDIMPRERFDSEALLALESLQQVAGQNIILFRGKGGRELLGRTLAERGAHVLYAECYERARPAQDAGLLLQHWRRQQLDVIIVTSGDALQNLYDMCAGAGRDYLLRTTLAVVSERLAARCRELGWQTEPIVANRAGDADMVTAIASWHRQHPGHGKIVPPSA